LRNFGELDQKEKGEYVMSDLLNSINILLAEAIASENDTINIYARLEKAYEGLGNEKFTDVAGLHKPNLFVFIRNIKTSMEELNNLKFAIESRIADKDKKESKDRTNKWNESIKKIHQNDEFTLEGIETWHISRYEMNPNSKDMHSPLFREEAVKLIASGFNLAFNFSHGTGSIHATDNWFTIELWQYMKKTEICKNTLDEVLDWLIYFYDNEKSK